MALSLPLKSSLIQLRLGFSDAENLMAQPQFFHPTPGTFNISLKEEC
jgi:hypothetical protein